jgi:hypothetical protein
MGARQTVLLNSLESALPACLPFYKQIAPITPLDSALRNPFQLIENTAALTTAESALADIPSVTSLDSALTKNRGGDPVPIPINHSDIWRSPLVTTSLFSYSYALSCTFQIHNPFVFFQFQTLSKKQPGWGTFSSRSGTPPFSAFSASLRCAFLPCSPSLLHFVAPKPKFRSFIFNSLRTLLHLRGSGVAMPTEISAQPKPLAPLLPARAPMLYSGRLHRSLTGRL